MFDKNLLKEIGEPSANMGGRILNNEEIINKSEALPPLERLKTFDNKSFEYMILEWAYGYVKQKRFNDEDQVFVKGPGGAGDMGRDIYIDVFCANGTTQNIVYQCKHYDHPIAPSDMWADFAKLCYYTFKGEISIPDEYRIVSPYGLGNSLEVILEKGEIAERLLSGEWDKVKILPTLVSEKGLREYIKKFDFGIVSGKSPISLLTEYHETPRYKYRFGGGLSDIDRRSFDENSILIDPSEFNYIKKILDAIKADTGIEYSDIKEVKEKDPHLFNFITRCRQSYFSAEDVRVYCRDTMCDGEQQFELFLKEIFDGIIEIVDSNHESCIACLKSALSEAVRISTSGILIGEKIRTDDRKGACHHLSNNNRIEWI